MTLNEELIHTAEILGTTAGVLTSGTVAWKYVISPVVKLLSGIKKSLDMSRGHGDVLAMIAEQFKPNGGNSLRDVLDRIESHTVSASGRVAALIEYHDVAAFECDVKGHCRWVSRRWCELFGMLPHEALGNGWIVGVHEGDRDKLFTEWGHAVDQKREFLMTYRVGNDEIGYTKVRGCTIFLRTPRGEVVGYTGTIEPVKE